MLTLYAHPLSSFCWKALIALYENDTPFDHFTIDQTSFAEFKQVWPIARMPVLRDSDRNQTIPEATIIIEYLDLHYPGRTRFLPADAEQARAVRQWDRFFDLYVQAPMQKIVTDRIRPEGRNDPHGVDDAIALLRTAYDVIEAHLGERVFAIGQSFSMADCAATPALFYAEKNLPLSARPRTAAYLERLKQRPSFARALAEAEPFFQFYPAG